MKVTVFLLMLSLRLPSIFVAGGGIGPIIEKALDIGPSTCIRLGGGSNCRKKCQGIMDSSTNKCYCTGSCEWSRIAMTCYCRNPSCNCGPSWG